jgi:hypothetical protein
LSIYKLAVIGGGIICRRRSRTYPGGNFRGFPNFFV